MIIKHLRFALRLFWKEKVYSFLNLAGLSLAIVSAIIVFLYLKSNFSYDKHFPKHKNIYRFVQFLTAPGVTFDMAFTGTEIGNFVQEDIAAVNKILRMRDNYDITITVENDEAKNTFSQENVIETDSTLFDFFPAAFLYGSPLNYHKPGAAIITSKVAMKLFGRLDVLGKEMKFNSDEVFTISGVIEPYPENTHYKFEVAVNNIGFRTFARDDSGNIRSEAHWNPDLYTYFLIEDGASIENIEKQLNSEIYNKYYKSFGDKIGGSAKLSLERLDRIHFHSDKDYDKPRGNLSYVYTLAAIGILILILAIINYMNLTTARAAGRVGEIGIRRVLGNFRSELIRMLLAESLLMTFLSMLMAVLVVYFIVYGTSFNQMIGYNLDFSITDPQMLLNLTAIWLIIGFFSGIYPAYYLSGFSMTKALKGKYSDSGNSSLRRVLLILQLTISTMVIIATVFMNKQINYLNKVDMGFEKDQLIRIPLKDSISEVHAEAFINKIKQYPYINNVSSSTAVPGVASGEGVMKVENTDGEMVQKQFKNYFVSPYFVETMGIEIIRGKNFEPNIPTNSAYIVNEVTVREMGWEEPIGKRISMFSGDDEGEIIGVFRNINYSSLHNPISSMLISQHIYYEGFILINYDPAYTEKVIEMLKGLWGELPFLYGFEYNFLQDGFEDQYKADTLQLQLVTSFSFICIFISILGLLGTTSYDASTRSREVSIRKALGATDISILGYFVSKYLLSVLISILIAIPAANYLVTEWFNNFVYHTSTDWFGFLWPSLFLAIMVFVIVAFQSLSIARKKPVEELN